MTELQIFPIMKTVGRKIWADHSWMNQSDITTDDQAKWTIDKGEMNNYWNMLNNQ